MSSAMPVPTMLEQIRGSLFGGAVGDALGYRVEFDSIASIVATHGPAGVTSPIGDAVRRS